MSDTLSGPTTESAEETPSSNKERRRTRRVGVSLQVRIRPASFADGDFEEIRTTQNASRSGFYFRTSLDRYRKGMWLRITSANEPQGGPDTWDDTGMVVRVQHRGDGFGVAVMLLRGGDPALLSHHAQPAEEEDSGSAERRQALRSSFSAPAELIDLRTGSRTPVRTTDLSSAGCYIAMLHPLPVGTAVHIHIRRENETEGFPAKVGSLHEGSGMGLVFDELTREQHAVISRWIRGQSASAPPALKESPHKESAHKGAPHVEKTAALSGEDHRFAIKLLAALTRKGILTQSEAVALLDELEA